MKLIMENWRRYLTEQEASWETWTIAELEDLINAARTGEEEAAEKALARTTGMEVASALPVVGTAIAAPKFFRWLYKKVNYHYTGTGGHEESESDDNPQDYPILDVLHIDPELLKTLDQEILNDIDEKYQEYLQTLPPSTTLGKVININDFLRQYVAKLTKNHVVITDQSGEG